MPEQRLQRCREAYETRVAFRLRQLAKRIKVVEGRESAAYRITQAQLASERAKDERV
jgi:uncharacterized protein YjhX (UPF0386 family)